MKYFLTFFFLNYALTFGQNYLTKGEVFDFEVGDEIQAQYYHNSEYIVNSSRIYLNKTFSLNNDTVFYTIKQHGYVIDPYAGTIASNFGTDTVIKFYTNLSDTLRLNQSLPLNIDDSCNYISDSIYSYEFRPDCLINVYKKWTDPLPGFSFCAIEFHYYEESFYKGLGYFYSESYYDVASVNRGFRLVYFKKGNNECGEKFADLKEEKNTNSKIIIFPNPVQNSLEIKSELYYDSFEIISIDGVKVLSDIFYDNKINVSALKSGLYFINLKLDERVISVNKFYMN
jgi:hypothetical protein